MVLLHFRRTIMIKVNIFSDKGQLDRTKAINALPGLIAFVGLLISPYVSDGLTWVCLLGTIVGSLLIYFPFYLNATIEATPDYMKLRYKKEMLLYWKDVKLIRVELKQQDFNHNYIKYKIEGEGGILLDFYITRHLFSSKFKQHKKLLSQIPKEIEIVYN
ncbi:MAG: hypothetical protein EAZ32_16500 [Cytophagia bacterium]|nr:MAG: hypothetical protein EAZ32_16500 [Cytophagia bacterium]